MKIKLTQNTLIRKEHNWPKMEVKKWDVLDVQKDLATYYVGYWVAKFVETTDASTKKIVKEETEKRDVKKNVKKKK